MAKKNPDRKNPAQAYHERFAATIIRQIREGTASWQKPWRRGETPLPTNFATGKPYRGGNTLYLAARGQERGFSDNRWATYRQIKKAGGHVRKGERGEKILFFTRNARRLKLDPKTGEPALDAKGRKQYEARAVVRTYAVFNVEQTRGLDLSRDQPDADAPDWQAHRKADAVIQTQGVPLHHVVGGDRAYYALKEDKIVLPARAHFPDADAYYATALHELGHATGHESRLDRETLQKGVKAGFGSPDYAREELRAEISAMMSGQELGVGHRPQHGAAYVEGWVKALDDNPREIYFAAAEAQRISDHLIEPVREQIKEIDNPAPEPDEPLDRAPERAPAEPALAQTAPQRIPATVPSR